MKTVSPWAIGVPLFVVGVTVVTGFWASTLPPSPDVVRLGAWSYDVGTDPIAGVRLSLIVIGLIAPVVAAFFAIGSDPRDKPDLLHLAFVGACVAACFAFGWRNTPYWANGVYQTHLGNYEYVDMDPKALPPAAWIGGVWSLAVLLFPLMLALWTAVVFPLVSWAWRHEAARARPLLAIAIVGLAWVPFFWRVEGYMGWLLD